MKSNFFIGWDIGGANTKVCIFDESLKLQNGSTLKNPTIAYQTYGKLNYNKSNAILICHALTGDQYAAGIHPITFKKGWWHDMIGKGKVFDTNSYFIICTKSSVCFCVRVIFVNNTTTKYASSFLLHPIDPSHRRCLRAESSLRLTAGDVEEVFVA